MLALTLNSNPSKKRNIQLVIEYDGTTLSGWQRQENAPSIQSHIEEALSSMLNQPIEIIGASRTDAGVHAHGQVAHFITHSSMSLDNFRRGINTTLMKNIVIRDVHEMPLDFHSRFDSLGKHYQYRLWIKRDRSPFAENIAWHRKKPLDLALMRQETQALIGEHDFTSFQASGDTAKTTIRHITSIDITQQDKHWVYIDIKGNAFLRKMVRIIVGTLVNLSEKKLDQSSMKSILESCNRTNAGVTAPPQGLHLMNVYYPNEELSNTQTQ